MKRPSQATINKADAEMDKKIGVKPGSAKDKKLDRLTGAKWPTKKGKE
jgi:hypothetical protein